MAAKASSPLSAARPLWDPSAAGAALLRGPGAAGEGRGLQHGPAPSPRAPQTTQNGCKRTLFRLLLTAVKEIPNISLHA